MCVCLDEMSSTDVNIGVVVSCAIGASLCILIILISIFLIVANRRQAKRDEQRERILSERMQRVWSVYGQLLLAETHSLATGTPLS